MPCLDDTSGEEESDDEGVGLPDFPSTFFQRKRGSQTSATDTDLHELPRKFSDDVSPTAPTWVKKLDLPGSTFDATFEKY